MPGKRTISKRSRDISESFKEVRHSSTAYFTLHIRPNFLYSARFEILDQIDQSQQVFESGKRSPSGEDHKRIGLSDIGPTRWEKGRLPIFGIIKNSPLAPTQPAINKPKLPSAPGVKWVGYPKMLFCILRTGCSSRPMPNSKLTITITTARAGD